MFFVTRSPKNIVGSKDWWVQVLFVQQSLWSFKLVVVVNRLPPTSSCVQVVRLLLIEMWNSSWGVFLLLLQPSFLQGRYFTFDGIPDVCIIRIVLWVVSFAFLSVGLYCRLLMFSWVSLACSSAFADSFSLGGFSFRDYSWNIAFAFWRLWLLLWQCHRLYLFRSHSFCWSILLL